MGYKVLLLEGIHNAAAENLLNAGCSVESLDAAIGIEELREKIRGVNAIGVRSKTHLPYSVLESAKDLLAIGCFCIGTDKVDLGAASLMGVPVFNAPFSNTRSVAELAIAEIIMLARSACFRSYQLHRGIWNKTSEGSCEVRHKTLGIVGYGHIGQQVGVLAESFGMKVIYYDIVAKLPLGTARKADTLEELLKASDFVTLHVPETSLTKGMIGKREIALMKDGAYLLNLARGSVVDISALREAILSRKLKGAAIDVFPNEPESNGEGFEFELQGLENVILTPHIGGSTEEAQKNIGLEVSNAIIDYLYRGAVSSAVNFPNVSLPLSKEAHRLLNIHKNVPGVLGAINGIISEAGANICSQYLGTYNDIGYLIMDLDSEISDAVMAKIDALDTTLKTRLIS
ncbi:MAG: phosphoglycerate dehydrogenase [Candidatus Dadabacteria bacterium]|nr:MAG: phosphoglycerate dehydrogenase [Candidatus Dadabacteria bacterium]